MKILNPMPAFLFCFFFYTRIWNFAQIQLPNSNILLKQRIFMVLLYSKDKVLMETIKFKIIKNVLTISLYNKETSKINLNNTNIIDNKDVVFSVPYIQENHELVASFLNVVIIKNEVKKAVIKEFSIVPFVLKILNNIPSISELTIKADEAITYPIFMNLLENKTFRKLDIYEIPPYLLERLDSNKDLTINIRSEIFFTSNFMGQNKLSSYSDIYYAKSIKISGQFNKEDNEDFTTFMNINNYVKNIYFEHFNAPDLNYILKLIREYKKINIKLVIKEKDNDLKEIYKTLEKYKKQHEKWFKESNITFKIDYSTEYKRANMFKQINLNFVKVCTISVIALIMILMVLNLYTNHVQARDIRSIEDDLRDLINMIDRDYTINPDGPDFEFIGPDGMITTTRGGPWLYHGGYFRRYSQLFERLREMNSDTVGWLQVNGTRIDYPVVQASDNQFYLNRDFRGRRNSMGWVFMDYRNNTQRLDDNTIIYAHNVNGGVMFGTLRYALNSSWQRNPQNQIITFNTPHAEMQWRIFSIYRIPNTTDYLITNFFNGTAHQEFLDKLTERSVHNFGFRRLTPNDKILTLSTCLSRGNDRLVVHAVLIQD